jgi:hypothetical protein
MTSVGTLHRNYVVNLELDAQTEQWQVVAIIHGPTGRVLPRLPVNFPSRAVAERYAKAAINAHLSKPRRYRPYRRR